jgi:hypothetical protein
MAVHTRALKDVCYFDWELQIIDRSHLCLKLFRRTGWMNRYRAHDDQSGESSD